MRSIVLIFVCGCCFGCGDSQDLASLKSSLRITGEEVIVKQDEALTILRENTTALAAIKAKVEAIQVVSPVANGKESDPESAPEPQGNERDSQNTPSVPRSTPAVQSSAVKMSWNVEGNWNPTILETAKHLREDHGIIADGMSHQQMHDMHAAAHEGRPVAIRSQPVQIINRGTYCPNGQCPMPRQVKVKRRR